MATRLELTLKADYREPVRSAANFVGREDELSRLVSILEHRPSATVLVAGHRGVGKSTLVDEALRRAGEAKKKRKQQSLVARLSLPHIRPPGDDTVDLRGQILRSLARSLHFAIKDSDVKKELKERAETLYRKSYLKSLEEQGQLALASTGEQFSKKSEQSVVKFAPGKTMSILLGSLATAAVATGGLAVAGEIAHQQGRWWGLASFLLVVALAAAVGTTIQRTRGGESGTTSSVAETKSTTHIGVYDITPETLEFELQELMTALREAKFSTVFVIDELDKLEVDSKVSAELEAHVIFKLLSGLKNFFTLGSGIFIFIAGEDFYAQLQKSMDDESYSLAHTLFTDRMFVHVLPYGDVERLVDALLDQPASDQALYRRFRNYLCWQSRNHVFDLLTILGYYVQRYDGDKPVVVAVESGDIDGRWHEGNLPEDWQTAAALQKFVGATFDEAARPGNAERFNQALWLVLLDAARELLAEDEVEVPSKGYLLPEDCPWVDRLLEADLDDLAGAVDRFFARLERYGWAVTGQPVEREVADADEDVSSVEMIPYALATNAQYPSADIALHAALTPFEKTFVDLADVLAAVRGNLLGAGLTSIPSDEDITKIVDLSAEVAKTSARKAQPRSRVRAALEEADALVGASLTWGVLKLVEEWAGEKGYGVVRDVATGQAAAAAPTRPATPVSLGEFEDLRPILTELAAEYVLLTGAETENQLLVISPPLGQDIRQRLSAAYAAASSGAKGERRREQRLPILEVRLQPPDQKIELPQEVVRLVSRKPPKTSRLAWLLGLLAGEAEGERIVTKKSRPVAGWHVFPLQEQAANLSDLTQKIEEVSFLGPSTQQ